MTVSSLAALKALDVSSLTDGASAFVVYRSSLGDNGGGPFYWDSSNLAAKVSEDTQNGIYVAPDSASTGASGAWVRSINGQINVLWFGADPSGVADSAAAIRQAIVASAVEGAESVKLPRGKYKVASNINILYRNVKIVGATGDSWLPDNGGGNLDRFGTEISFTGTGDLFTLGTDTGQYATAPWTAAYDGYQSLTIENILMVNNNTDTALNNGQGNYQDGSAGLRDYRGGDIKTKDVGFKNFHYGFWGHQSDINTFDRPVFSACKVGMYLGPRSDQQTVYHPYILGCDTAVDFDGAAHSDWYSPVFVGNGSDAEYALDIRKATRSHNFYSPWFEHYQGEVTGTKPFIGIGVTAEVSGSFDLDAVNINFVNPIILTNAAGADYHVAHLVEIDKSTAVTISNPSPGGNFYNVVSLANLLTDNAYVHIDTKDLSWENKLFTVTGGSGAGASAEIDSTHKVLRCGRLYVNKVVQNVLRDFYLSAEGDKRITMTFPDAAEDWTEYIRFGARHLRGYLSRNASPDFHTWNPGDSYTFNDPVATGYVGKVCVTGGTLGTYTEGLTATADGTTTVTLSASTSVLKVGMYLTINGDTNTVVSISGTTMVMSGTVTTGAGLAIAFFPAVLKGYGTIEA